VAAWAETEIVLAADLGDGTDDPRATAPDLLRRALAALPAAARAGQVGLRADAGHDTIEMNNAQVAVAQYCPAWWPASTRLLIRRVLLDPAQVSADPRSRRRRTLHPDQRALPFPELAEGGPVHGYSFILTNLDVTTPARAAAAEHWYRHRTSVENLFRDSKLGAALIDLIGYLDMKMLSMTATERVIGAIAV
jgi:hypothetical protein